jgi:hypothetical protein
MRGVLRLLSVVSIVALGLSSTSVVAAADVTVVGTNPVNIANETGATASGVADAVVGVDLTVSDGTPAHDVVASTTSVGDGSWSIPSLNLSGLDDGPITYTVACLTCTGAQSAFVAAVKDTVAPAVAITAWTHPVNNADKAAASISGTGENGDSIDLTVSDGTPAHNVIDSTTVAGGTWSFSGLVLTGLDDGSIGYTVVETDGAGNTANDTKTATKDVVAPAVAMTSWTNPITAANKTAGSAGGTAENGAEISLTVTDEHGHTAGSDTVSSGTWSISGLNFSSLDDGDVITFSVEATDAVGNTATATRTATKDTVVPAVAITAWTHPVNDANKATASVGGTGENGVTVDLTVSDGVPAHNVTRSAVVSGGVWSFSGLNLSGLLDGTIDYTALATDGVGNTNSALKTATKDTAAPSIAITAWTHPVNNANKGSASISGTGETGDTIDLTVTDGVPAHNVTASTTVAGGTWSFSGLVLTGLSDGTITYTVVATDGVGNTANDVKTTGKDVVAPTVAITAWTHPINAANEGGASAGGTGESGDTLALTVTDQHSHSVPGSGSVSGGTWTITGLNLSSLTDGDTITYSVVATDAVGNASTPATQTATKDVVAPSVAITAWTHPVTAADAGSAAVSGTGETGDTIDLTVTDGTPAHNVIASTTVAGGTWSFSGLVLTGLSDGTITYTVVATDGVGNTAPDSKTATKDTVANVHITSAPGIGQVNLTAVVVSGTADSDIATVTVTLSDGSVTLTNVSVSVTTGNWTTSFNATTLADGTITAHVAGTDALGNSGSDSTTTTKDASAVAPGKPTGVSGVAGKGSVTVSWVAPVFNGGSTILHFIATASGGGRTCQADGASATSCKVTGLTAGLTYTFTVTATNAAGTGLASDASTGVVPLATTKPDKPTAVTGVGFHLSAVVSWTAPVDDGGMPITAYHVTSVSGGKTCNTTGATTCTVNGLSDHTPYAFTVTASNSVGTSDASLPSSSVLPREGASFVPLTPSRVLDTYTNLGWTPSLTNRSAVTFQVTGQFPGDPTRNVPATATAITGVLTVSRSTALGYLALTPTPMDNPTTSTLNFPSGDTRSTGVTVPLSPTGTLSVTYVGTAGKTAEATLDITGYFLLGSSGTGYSTLTPNRILDSRTSNGAMLGGLTAGTHKTFQVTGRAAGDSSKNVPSSAVAVTGTLTVTGQTKAGYISLGPDALDVPATTSLSFPVGDNRATGITVKLGAGGTLSVVFAAAAGAKVQVIFDVTGFFIAGSAGAMYVPVTPNRILDSRSKLGLPGSLRAYRGVTFPVTMRTGDLTKQIPSSAVAVTGILTVTGQTALGYLALTKTATNAPTTSTLNFPKGDNRATGVTVPLGPGGVLGVCYAATPSTMTTAVIFDVSGYFIF